jgi:hypothetical protein
MRHQTIHLEWAIRLSTDFAGVQAANIDAQMAQCLGERPSKVGLSLLGEYRSTLYLIPPLTGEVDRRAKRERSGGVIAKSARSRCSQPPPGSLRSPPSPFGGGIGA